MAVVVVTSSGLTEIAECPDCGYQYSHAEIDDLFEHEGAHWDGDCFAMVFTASTPYILGSIR